MEKEGATVESVIVNNGLIERAGNLQDCLHFLNGRSYEKIDLAGKTILPGFIDSHLHLIGHGEKLEKVNLSVATTKKEVRLLLQAASLKNDVVIAEGFHEDLTTDGEISKADLDVWFPLQPVILIRRCYHTILLNECAMHKYKLADWDIPEKEIGKDINGQLNGYIYEGTMQRLRKLLQTYPLQLLERYIEAGIRDANSYGITSLVSEDLSYYGDWAPTLQAFTNTLYKTDNPSMKLHLLAHHTVWKKVDEQGFFDHPPHPYLSIGSVKFFLDGSLGSRTAYLKQQYSDDTNNYGIRNFSEQQLEAEVQNVRKSKRTVAFHIIGDAAFEMAVSVLKKYPPVIENQKDRLIHLSMLPEDGIEKLRGMPIVLDLQPIFYSSDFAWIKERIGSDRLPFAYLLATFVRNGFICGGSSDAPIETINPWEGIYAAIERKPMDQPAQRESLTLYEAIYLYTKGSAQTIGSQCGEIRAGYAADFQIYETDPFHVAKEQVRHLRPNQLFVNGEIISYATSL
ncbi:amidohydrolase [Bacillus sp. AGMB 02131]|uniref:Amidohydrolase n=1 Tax=Peribacillus faecalis TaxID=2772559 RepID=A0A927D214_9BACI|nr:amidohydrolase [Peribacillus faecalis]MBD3110085.1 amidohydrolase [Peribacillus faecalis]